MKLNKMKHIIMNELRLPLSGYMVYMGGALVVYGVREETRDLDIGVSDSIWIDLKRKYNVKDYEVTKSVMGDDKFTLNILGCEIELFKKPNMPKLLREEEAKFRRELCVQGIDRIVRMKTMLNRTKDIQDLEKIKELGL